MEIEPGELYLGGVVDADGARTGDPLVSEAADLTTHGVIVGMTGSGKTGLGIDLLEEALLSGIPALVLDPKGDMGNLLLTFPSFRPEDFRPWIDEGEARREGVTPDELAAGTAKRWKEGLESWEIGPDRMRRLGTSAGMTIYTPGSSAGVPVNVIGSLAAPDRPFADDPETFRDEIEGFVSSLLTLAGVEADPVSSPEHILLATLVEHAWSQGTDLDLAALIGQVMTPPIRKLGVFDLDTFFPPKDRTALAMRLNALVASPSFASWMTGVPLDVETMLFRDGNPQAAIVYLAHLSDAERQFVVTLLLSKVVTWMRGKSGSSDLRTLIYMDEVYGFCPPTAEPPSKKPILTILKQARAYGVGMVLSTQNPVDLDYKAMSNAGTWMIGRLQTERDKARILEGIRSAAGGVDVGLFDRMISGLGKRTFVLHSTRSSEPTPFTTRWAMSYLAGPLTREQVERLTGEVELPEPEAATPAAPLPDDATPVAPAVADGIGVAYLDPAAPWAAEVGADPAGTVLAPAAAATVRLRYDDRYAEVDHTEEYEAVIFPLADTVDDADLHHVDHDPRDFAAPPPEGAAYALGDADLSSKAFWKRLETSLLDHLVREQKLTVWKNPTLKLYSRVGETEEAFRARCAEAAESAADVEIASLKDRYEDRIDRVRDRIAAADRRVRELSADVETRRQQEVMAGAGDLLGAILGGRSRSSSISRAANRRAQTRRTEERLATAQDKAAGEEAELRELEDELEADVLEISDRWNTAAGAIEPVDIPLERSDVSVEPLVLVWVKRPASG